MNETTFVLTETTPYGMGWRTLQRNVIKNENWEQDHQWRVNKSLLDSLMYCSKILLTIHHFHDINLLLAKNMIKKQL